MAFDIDKYRRQWLQDNPKKVLFYRIKTYIKFIDRMKIENPDMVKEALRQLSTEG